MPKDGEPTLKDDMPLQPQVALEPFHKWGMDFNGPIDPPSRQKMYIIVCTDYLTKALESILSKVVSNNERDWEDNLVEATSAYNITWKTTTRFTPYDLVYGKKAFLSIEFEDNTLRSTSQLGLDVTRALQERLLQLNGLDEFKMQALLHTEVIQLQMKVWHDNHIKENVFQ
eukprot:PITA_29416